MTSDRTLDVAIYVLIALASFLIGTQVGDHPVVAVIVFVFFFVIFGIGFGAGYGNKLIEEWNDTMIDWWLR